MSRHLLLYTKPVSEVIFVASVGGIASLLMIGDIFSYKLKLSFLKLFSFHPKIANFMSPGEKNKKQNRRYKH